MLAPFWSTADTAADPGAAVAVPSPQTDDRAGETRRRAPASLQDLIEEGENRVGKAIADEAAKSVKQAVGGGSANDGTVERR